MITIQKVTSNVHSVPSRSPRHLVTRRAVFSKTVVQYSTVHIPNVFCDGHLQIISCVYCNRQVHRDFLITLYNEHVSIFCLFMPCYTFICGLSRSTIFFRIISQMARFSGGGDIEHKVCFDFLYNFCLKHFPF